MNDINFCGETIPELKKFILDTEIKHRKICDMHLEMRQELHTRVDKLQQENEALKAELKETKDAWEKEHYSHLNKISDMKQLQQENEEFYHAGQVDENKRLIQEVKEWIKRNNFLTNNYKIEAVGVDDLLSKLDDMEGKK